MAARALRWTEADLAAYRARTGAAGANGGDQAAARPPAPGEVAFRVDGIPVPKLRHRHRIAHRADGSAYSVSYTPKRTKAWERELRKHAVEAMAGRRPYARGVAVTGTITFFLPVPQSWSNARRRAAVGQLVAKKPDADNLGKAVKDALNGVVYEDDAQLADVRLVKRYGSPGVAVQLKGPEDNGNGRHDEKQS